MDNRSLITNASDDFKDMTPRDIKLSRLKLMQATNPEVKDGKCAYGDWFDTGAQKIVCKRGSSVQVVPYMWFKDWIEFNPKNEPGKKILNRSSDPASRLADEAARFVKVVNYKGKEVQKVTEIINYIVGIPEYTMNYEDMFLLSFMKTSHKEGINFLNALRKTRLDIKNPAGEVIERVQAPIWAYAWSVDSYTAKTPDGDEYLIARCKDGVQNLEEAWPTIKELSDQVKMARETMKANAAQMNADEANSEKPVEATVHGDEKPLF